LRQDYKIACRRRVVHALAGAEKIIGAQLAFPARGPEDWKYIRFPGSNRAKKRTDLLSSPFETEGEQ
jgi:hypothetical protein